MLNAILEKLKFFDVFRVKEDNNGIRYANQMVRALTTVIDVVIIALAAHLLSYILTTFIFNVSISLDLLSDFLGGKELSDNNNYQVVRYLFIWFIQQIVLLFAIGIFIVHMWYRFGVTPARYLFGIKIVDADTHENITKKQAVKRLLSVPLSFLSLGLGVLWGHFDKRGQTFHDKIANTVVIIDQKTKKN